MIRREGTDTAAFIYPSRFDDQHDVIMQDQPEYSFTSGIEIEMLSFESLPIARRRLNLEQTGMMEVG